MHICHVRDLGQVPYQQAWDLQAELAAKISAGETPPTLLLLEHPHTITFGRSGKLENLLWDETQLEQRGVQVFWVDRGGDATYHGPGQLVGYPLIPLNSLSLTPAEGDATGIIPKADYVGYLRKLEQVLMDTLKQFGLSAGRVKDLTGVWIKGAKIAAIGVKVDARGVSRHGFALNVDPDMSYWESIIGCGLEGYSTTSMARLMTPVPSRQQVMEAIVSAFEGVFEVECHWVT
jgi:lipoyl(octanoyl) transferase